MGNWNSTTIEYFFHLITLERDKITLGSDVTVPCFLSPGSPHGAMDMEIRWFKETDCVCIFKKGQVIKGKGYEHRATLLPKELKRGNVSLTLQHFTKSDSGDYMCQVNNGTRTEEITVRVKKQSFLYRYKHIVCDTTAAVLVILLLLAAIGAEVAVKVATVVTAVAAATVAIASHITFLMVNRRWNVGQRQKMEGSAVLAETLACLDEKVGNMEEINKTHLAALKMELYNEIGKLKEGVKNLKEAQSSYSRETQACLEENVKNMEKVTRNQLAALKMELYNEIGKLQKGVENLKEDQSSNSHETLASLDEKVTNMEKNNKEQLAALNMELNDKTGQLQKEVKNLKKEQSSYSHVRRLC